MKDKNKIVGVYLITNLINGKKYIGSSKHVVKRLYEHKRTLCNKKHKNLHLQSAWNKHGESHFKFELLEICNIKILLLREDFWITYYNTKNREYGYNIDGATKYGSVKRNRSEETKKRLSEAGKLDWIKRKLSGYKLSEETKLKIGRAFKGRKISKNVRQKIRESLLGRKFSQERKNNISKAKIGSKLSEDHKKKIGISNKGKIRSQETRQKISIAKKGLKLSQEHIQKIIKTKLRLKNQKIRSSNTK
ncbi:MAG: NUMOD3 domain-containing DNA-binding protein [Atribacterota bacterium]|nr:NUMOD3 domain-containing DNA-binding protein [Atribacterota bacterium]